jgi:hypothetical protein
MSKKHFVVILLVLLATSAFAAGCRARSAASPATAAQSGHSSATRSGQPITSAGTFLTLYKQWAGSLANLAGEINNSYSQWSNQQISKQEFLSQLYATQKKLESLKMTADYQNFELSTADRQKVNSQTITRTYFMAEKGVNDFLYYAPHLNDQQIKAKYNDLIQYKYANSYKELQTLLGQ